jgi:hypothetical protein
VMRHDGEGRIIERRNRRPVDLMLILVDSAAH